ncbi:MAG: HEAT repeat domain-containing protein [Akkermansiaceae bacterium]|nr:HEAT repeat domain-containing protein [Akkermansiaceae bacterium]MCP5547947.1 HEAT repeat domain-containing protein [Akkermansiaceae bacterium]
MKRLSGLGLACAGLLIAILSYRQFVEKEGHEMVADAEPHVSSSIGTTRRLTSENLKSITSGVDGESHSVAVDVLVDMAKRREALAHGDMKVLLSFISAPKPEGLSDVEWEERVNVVLNALRGQESDVPGLTDFLLATAEDHPSRILRLYAMQHLALWQHREKSVEKQREIVALFERLAMEDGGEYAGAAVMFLNDLEGLLGSHGQERAHQNVIGRAAFKLIVDPAARPDVRISALHTCTDRRMTEVLPTARRIAADTRSVLPLRKAAVHAIGRMGGGEDLDLLSRLGKDSPELRPATEPAANSLRGR